MKIDRVELEPPFVSGLTSNNEIDLDALGASDLLTCIHYTGMEENHEVVISWLGADADGTAFDDAGSKYYVEPPDLEKGIEVKIDNAVVRGAVGGQAFYSYVVTGFGQSQRRFCFVGVREKGGGEGLAVVQAVQSHDLVIKPDELDSAGVMFIVTPYQAMQIGDVINFTFQGYDEDGYEEDPVTEKLTVKKEHFDNLPIMFTVGKNIFRFIDPGTAKVYYSIDFVDGDTLDSPVQDFVIDSDASLPTPLSAPRIANHIPGDPLDPGSFRDGLTIQIDGYPGMSISDHVTLYWHSPVRELFTHVRVDASTQTVGAIALHVPGDFVLENQGLNVRLSYLYSREGAGLQSQPLNLAIATARVLSVPLIDNVTPDEDKDHGTLLGRSGFGGVRVRIPDVLLPGEHAEVQWRGWPAFGEYVAKTPEGDNPRVFLIPEAFVPANMGRGLRDQSRRFEVSYRVLGSGSELDSDPYHLRITPIDPGGYPQIQCEGVSGQALSLSAVPSEGARLTLDTWMFGRAGQLLHIWVSGVGQEGDLAEDLRTASIPVTETEADTGVEAKLPKRFLEQLKLNEPFTLHVALSFDGGALYRAFPQTNIKLES
ncbi:hypothetical protein [Pseudomonas promysalinigenes]|uniref:Uncharacterized protein n=1 Tax=Pseudomonas promysalinigenes TaxID=485898 RepID=A0ABY6AP18_9PSED|nr:hypothetical protein [Pseudomonas promysalinigenes]UXH41386.1 hypothetical protein N5C08_07590 [Pseudomonas promysalinigenes]